MNQKDAATALAKVNAYLQCGKVADAQLWADKLRNMLSEAGL